MYEFNESDVVYVVDTLMDDLSNVETIPSIPIGFVLGGQPGAGKSVIEKLVKSQFKDIIIVNGDDYRKYHPQFDKIVEEHGADYPEYTGKFSSAVTELFIDRLIEKRKDIIVEGTLRTVEAPLNTCHKMKENGYKTYLGIIAVKPELSYLSTIYRYEEMIKNGILARKTPQLHHDKVVDKLVDNCKMIVNSGDFDEVLIFNRKMQCISKMSQKRPYEVLNDAINGKWTKDEITDFDMMYHRTLEMKENRNAMDIEEFKKNYALIREKIMENFGKNEIVSHDD